MKKLLFSFVFLAFAMTTILAQSVSTNKTLDCDNVCEVEKTVQIGALLGVKITNYQRGKGAAVLKVLDHTAADRYAFKKLDIIMAVDGMPITSMRHLVKTIQAHNPSDLVNIEYLRGDEMYKLDVILGAKKTKRVKEMVCCDNEAYFNSGNISLYPNPSISSINVEMENAEKGKYVFQVFNIKGERVITQVNDFTAGFTNNINISSIPSGEYFLRISSGDASFTKSFIKRD